MELPISDADDKTWEGMQPLEATAAEKKTIDDLMKYNPKLDYLMALVLVKSSEEDLQKLIDSTKDKERPALPQSTIIKDAFTIE